MNVENDEVRIRAVCLRKGHAWKQERAYTLGYEVCARWRCDARRVDPRALPPDETEDEA